MYFGRPTDTERTPLPGAKTEDTVVTTATGIEVLTVDPAWPMLEGPAGPRPDLLVVG